MGTSSSSHGNGQIWAGLWGENIIVVDQEKDGSLRAKIGWWRGVSGQLRVEGRRLDSAAPPAHARVPSGYGDEGFQPVVITFPSAGCWELTGRVGDASLTFVTLVLAAAAES